MQLCMSPVIKTSGTVSPASLFFERFYMSSVKAQIRYLGPIRHIDSALKTLSFRREFMGVLFLKKKPYILVKNSRTFHLNIFLGRINVGLWSLLKIRLEAAFSYETFKWAASAVTSAYVERVSIKN